MVCPGGVVWFVERQHVSRKSALAHQANAKKDISNAKEVGIASGLVPGRSWMDPAVPFTVPVCTC